MSLENFSIVEENPNGVFGAEPGCLCSPYNQPTECEGPFVVFQAAEMMTPSAPQAVACKKCVLAAARKLEKGESLGGR